MTRTRKRKPRLSFRFVWHRTLPELPPWRFFRLVNLRFSWILFVRLGRLWGHVGVY